MEGGELGGAGLHEDGQDRAQHVRGRHSGQLPNCHGERECSIMKIFIVIL